MVQLLGLLAFTAQDQPRSGTKVLQAVKCSLPPTKK